MFVLLAPEPCQVGRALSASDIGHNHPLVPEGTRDVAVTRNGDRENDYAYAQQESAPPHQIRGARVNGHWPLFQPPRSSRWRISSHALPRFVSTPLYETDPLIRMSICSGRCRSPGLLADAAAARAQHRRHLPDRVPRRSQSV